MFYKFNEPGSGIHTKIGADVVDHRNSNMRECWIRDQIENWRKMVVFYSALSIFIYWQVSHRLQMKSNLHKANMGSTQRLSGIYLYPRMSYQSALKHAIESDCRQQELPPLPGRTPAFRTGRRRPAILLQGLVLASLKHLSNNFNPTYVHGWRPPIVLLPVLAFRDSPSTALLASA